MPYIRKHARTGIFWYRRSVPPALRPHLPVVPGFADKSGRTEFTKTLETQSEPEATSRGPIVDEAALIAALKSKQLAGAALDVFDIEPLPKDHPFRKLGNVFATPHLCYVSRQQYEVWYGDTAASVCEWLAARTPAFASKPAIRAAE
jgi:hypothetical protein